MDTTIDNEIKRLVAEARRLDYATRSRNACPRAACAAEADLKAVIERIAELRLKQEEAGKP